MVNKKHDDEFQDDIELTNEDTAPTDMELETEDEQLGDKLKKLRQELKDCHAKRHEEQEEFQRHRADFLNARKRQEEQYLRDRERITLSHIEELLPLADSFDMAMKSAQWGSADEVWRKGVEGIYAQLMSLFKSYNVTILEPLGETFNPHEHEALIDNGGEHKVSQVIQRGYKRGDVVIRPAKVAVG